MAKSKNQKEEVVTKVVAEPINSPKSEQLLENPEMMYDRAEMFVRKYQKFIIAGLAAVVVTIGGVVGFRYYQNSQQEEALTQLFPAEYYMEADSVKKALKGDGNYLGAIQVADDYSVSKAGKLANLYAGMGFMKEGKFQDAINALEKFSSNDMLVQARAYTLTGDAYMELNKLDDAIKAYKKAVSHYPNKFFTPNYMMKLALAYELNKDFAAATKVYEQLLMQFPDASDVNNAKKYKAKVEGMQVK
jgi:TolA-binding protein